VDPVQRVKKLRQEYERALDAAESRRVAYHEAVLGLIEHGGTPLQEFAEELGLSHEHVHEIVRQKPRRRRRTLALATGSILGVLVLAAATLGGLRLAHAPPFVVYVRAPSVLQMKEAAAVRRVKQAGLRPRVVFLRRDVPRSLSHHVLGVSSSPDERLPKGSTVTLYVVIPRTAAHHTRKHS
jgi:hypothetical protein